MNTRIAGYDFARSLALFGLLITALIPVPILDFEAGDFELHHIIFILGQLHSFIRGGALETFLLLGGVGLSLRTQQSRTTDDAHRFGDSRKRLIRRAALLMVVGIGCNLVLPTNLLSSYGGYILFGALLLTVSNRWLWSLASVCVIISFALVFLLLPGIFSREMLESRDTHLVFGFSVEGMIYNLFSGSLYSLFYWSVFLLIGMWLGRQEVPFPRKRRNLLLRAMGIALVTSCVLWVLVLLSNAVWSLYSSDSIVTWWYMGTGLIIGFLAGAGISLAIIMGSFRLIEKYPDAKWTRPFIATGRLARLF